ncbi:MAG: branched-chain amino acid ABC transporter permease, partial [Solirubrobacteraceae bacterium]
TGLWTSLLGAIFAAIVAFAYQSSRRGRLLRAAREDASAAQAIGVHIVRERLLAFGLSGAICGLGGALLVHQLGSITTDQVYLELTFLTLAMLVIGGSNSLWGATVGALAISLLDSWLNTAENTVHVVFFTVTLPNGSSDVILGVIMTLMILFRPSGLTGGSEFSVAGAARFGRRLASLGRGTRGAGPASAAGSGPASAAGSGPASAAGSGPAAGSGAGADPGATAGSATASGEPRAPAPRHDM